MAEAMALIDEARRYGVQVRLMGGLAVRRYCTDLGFMDREYSDIDLVGLSVQNRELHEVFTRLGYAENRLVTRGDRRRPAPVRQDRGAGGRRRRLPHRRRARGRPPGALVDHVDLFMDVMRMDHDLDVRDRLLVDDYAISPADAFIGKLQIGRINEKDAHDVIALLKDVPAAPGRRRDLHLPALRRRDVRGRLGALPGRAGQHRRRPPMVDDYDLDEEEMARVYGRLAALREAIEAEEKSVGWRLRARVGKRVAWRRTIEDTEGTDVIAPEWDWRRDLG